MIAATSASKSSIPEDTVRAIEQVDGVLDYDENKIFQESLNRCPEEIAVAQSKRSATKQPNAPTKFGTFFGVFLPCVQNLLGVILFLRLPWIVGQAGVLGATGVVMLCTSSTLLTALSLSALATNGKVPAGGPYSIVAKTLGPEVGGAVGVLFYFGTTFDVTLSVLGGIEALFVSFEIGNRELKDQSDIHDEALRQFCIAQNQTALPVPSEYTAKDCYYLAELFSFDRESIGLVTTLILGCIAYMGMNFVSKISLLLEVVVVVAIILIFIGLFVLIGQSETENINRGSLQENLLPKFEKDFDTGILPSFATLIALFYPSVTDIMTGSNRSGVLRKPSRSIPSGTLEAIFCTTLLYLVLLWMFGAIASDKQLKANKLIASTIAWPDPIPVSIGIILSCLGAGLQSLTGAPELLHKIAADGHITFLKFIVERPQKIKSSVPQRKQKPTYCSQKPSLKGYRLKWINKLYDNLNMPPEDLCNPDLTDVHQSEDNLNPDFNGVIQPKKAVILTSLLAAVLCLAGNIDYITPITTMFFLAMYGMINLSCFASSFLKSPGFRPTWKYYHWGTALAGFLICLTTMFIISTAYALVAIAIAVVVFFFIKLNREKKEWGDAVVGFRLEQATQALLSLSDSKNIGISSRRTASENNLDSAGIPNINAPNRNVFSKRNDLQDHAHLKGQNWRPQVMVLCELNLETYRVSRPGLLRFAAQLKKGRGLVSAVSVLPGIIGEYTRLGIEQEKARYALKEQLVEHDVKGFATIVVSPTNFLLDSFGIIFQAQGLGPLQANTVLIGWPRSWKSEEKDKFPKHLQDCSSHISCECRHRSQYVGLLQSVVSCNKAIVVLMSNKKLNEKQSTRTVSKPSTMHSSKKKIRALLSTSFDEGLELNRATKLAKQIKANFNTISSTLSSSLRKGGSKSLIVEEALNQSRPARIDVWWLIHDGGILILLPYLLKQHRKWNACSLRVFLILPETLHDAAPAKTKLMEFLDHLRIKAEVNVVPLNAVDIKDLDENRTLVPHRKLNKSGDEFTKLTNSFFSPESIGVTLKADSSKVDYASKRLLSPQLSRKQRGLTEIFAHNVTKLVANAEELNSSSDSLESKFFKLNTSGSVSENRTPQQKLEKRLQTAIRINSIILSHSEQSQLVVLNLPISRKTSATEFIKYTEALTHNLKKVVLIRGNGHENVIDFD